MGNFAKTLAYLKRNGIKYTYYAAKERLLDSKGVPYDFKNISKEEAARECAESQSGTLKISVIVPVYETRDVFLKRMIESVIAQTYPNWELILADASVSDGPRTVISGFSDDRIKYIHLSENKGISSNSNEALKHATGEYIALLDHDDLLTPDALFEVTHAIHNRHENGINTAFLYSDEDKCNSDESLFYEPNIKPEFNLDYLFSNNYICHLSVFEAGLIKEAGFRSEYDGAQDHDIILRTAGKLALEGRTDRICHIPKVLYHWRCHDESTAANPASKEYAYEAGRRAVADFTGVSVSHTLHKGFYHADYGNELFLKRPDIAAIGGFNTRGNKITGGVYDSPQNVFCKNMNKYFSGKLHRAHCTMDVYALDILSLIPSPRVRDIYEESLYNCIKELSESKVKDKGIHDGIVQKWSFNFAEKALNRGLRLLFDPEFNRTFSYGYLSLGEKLPVSVIIPNYNGKEYLKPCIESILASERKPDEIIVVDNASTDNSLDTISEYTDFVKIIRHDDNLGFTGAVNHGIVASRNPYIYLLNNDTRVEPDTIENLVKAMDSDEKLFSLGSLMLSMDNPDIIDNAGDYYNLLGYARARGNGKSRFNYKVDNLQSTFSACAGAAMYRARIFNEIGLFDDRHFAYLEDVDIGYRARIYGYENAVLAGSLVYHKGSAVSGSKHNAFKVSHSSRNSVYVAYKNMPFLQYLCNLPFLIAGRLFKTVFFLLKGLGGVYIKGTFRGIFGSLGPEGMRHHVKFKFKHFGNYFKIQIRMIISTFLGK